MGKFIDLTGQKFGRLTVLERTENNGKNRQAAWLCKCDCGNTTVVLSDNLKRGHTTSCGCISKEVTAHRSIKHGHCKGRKADRLYNIWVLMKHRCYNSNDKRRRQYKDKGITVCDEWLHDFQTFYEWAMSSGYADNLTIDRIDVNGNYEPSNCRWVTQKTQQNNKGNNRTITYNGETYTIAQWAEKTGVNYSTLRYRLDNGWSVEKALTKKR